MRTAPVGQKTVEKIIGELSQDIPEGRERLKQVKEALSSKGLPWSFTTAAIVILQKYAGIPIEGYPQVLSSTEK